MGATGVSAGTDASLTARTPPCRKFIFLLNPLRIRILRRVARAGEGVATMGSSAHVDGSPSPYREGPDSTSQEVAIEADASAAEQRSNVGAVTDVPRPEK